MEIKRKISLKDKKKLKKDISKLGYNEHCEIYNIIRKDTDKISENSNGIFINLKFIKDETLNRVEEFVHYCKNNKKITTKYLKKINKEKKKDKIENKLTFNDNLLEGYESFDRNKFKNLNLNLKLNFNIIQKNDSDIEKEIRIKKNPILNNKKIKLFGVSERIMKKCRNINKELYFNDTYTSNNDDDISELEMISNISQN